MSRLLNKLKLNLDKIVIGSSINAAEFALENKAYFIRNTEPDIFILDKFETNLSFDGVEYEYLLDYWKALVWHLSFEGYVPFSGLVRTIRFIDDNTISVITKNDRAIRVNFKECHVFDLANVSKFPIEGCEELDKFRILDWFEATWRKVPKKDFYYIDDEVLFGYHTLSLGTKSFIIGEMELPKDSLGGFETSSTMSRLKLAGPTAENKDLASVKRDLKLSFWERELIPLKETIYKENNNIFYRGQFYENRKAKKKHKES